MSIPPQLVMVEDNPLDAELTLAILRDSGLDLDIQILDDPVDALAYLRREGRHADRSPGDPALVLLDINMPHLNGMDMLDAIRGDARTRHLPVVMFTTSTARQDVERSYRLGADAYVVKPLRLADMERTLRTTVDFWTHLTSTRPPVLRAL